MTAGRLVISILLGFPLGTLLGGLAACMGYRLPRKISGWGRSSCPKCGHVLSIWEVVPLLSYLFLKGRCRHCGKEISPWYFWVEAAGGVISAALLFLWGPSWGYLGGLTLLACGLTAAVSDLKDGIIPDTLNIALAVCGILLGIIKGPAFVAWWGGLGAAASFTVLKSTSVITRKKMGGGDIKFLSAAGFILGPLGVCLGILFTSISALLVEILVRRRRFGEPFPCGPYLSFGTLAAWAILPLIFKFKGGF